MYVLATKKNNQCLETNVIVHQAQKAVTQPRRAPCKGEHVRNETYLSKGSKYRTAVRPYSLWQQPLPLCPGQKGSCGHQHAPEPALPGAPHDSLCRVGFRSLSSQTRLHALQLLPFPVRSWRHSLPGVRWGGRCAHSWLSASRGLPDTSRVTLPSPTAGNLHQISNFFCSINGRKGAEPRLESVVLWPSVCHTFPYFKFSPMTNALFKSFEQK